MAGDWIKMRASLENSPKVIAIAKKLESDKAVGRALSNGFGGTLREIVTRDVTRDVTVMSLFRVWCAANEHTSDGVWHGIELDDLDHVARIKGFGRMMEAVGWAVFDADNNTVTFPNFLEYNAPAKEGRDKGAAERQRRYREKQRQSNAESDVTRDVTLRATSDVEKRREESITKQSTSEKEVRNKPPSVDEVGFYIASIGKDTSEAQAIVDYYSANGWVQGTEAKPIVDWQAVVRIWFSKQIQSKQRAPQKAEEVRPEHRRFKSQRNRNAATN